MMTASKSVAVSTSTLCAAVCAATAFRGITCLLQITIGRIDGPMLVQPIKAHRATGHDPVLGLRRHSLEAIQQHLWRTREEAVGVRVVGGPQNFVRADIIGEHLDAALDRFERDPAIALKELARAGLQP